MVLAALLEKNALIIFATPTNGTRCSYHALALTAFSTAGCSGA